MCAPLCVAAILLLSHGIAQAQPAPTGGPLATSGSAAAPAATAAPDVEGEASDDSERLPSARPAGPDWRTGHFIVTGKVGAALPAGTTGDVATRDLVTDGLGFGGSIGVGISRYTVLALSGSYALLPGASACELRSKSDPNGVAAVGCAGRTLSIGAEFVYHVGQGIAFDPWISTGAGYRWSNWAASYTPAGQVLPADDKPQLPDGHGQYHGLDFLRLALGGDFYPLPGFGFGAYFEAGAGTFLARPPPDRGASAYAFFEIGARIAFDPLRWNWSPARGQVGRLR